MTPEDITIKEILATYANESGETFIPRRSPNRADLSFQRRMNTVAKKASLAANEVASPLSTYYLELSDGDQLFDFSDDNSSLAESVFSVSYSKNDEEDLLAEIGSANICFIEDIVQVKRVCGPQSPRRNRLLKIVVGNNTYRS